MGFMQPEVKEGDAYVVETKYGTVVVPCDIHRDAQTCAELQVYMEGDPLEPDEAPEVRHGWLYRLSAPGYMDCTDWGIAPTKKEAEDVLKDLYGSEEQDG